MGDLSNMSLDDFDIAYRGYEAWAEAEIPTKRNGAR
jgi:hypothetical protein